MELKLYRKWYTTKSTIGELFVNGTSNCFILEDTCRDINRDGDLSDEGESKVFGKTCIPAGRYEVVITYSNRFKRDLPEIVGVPNYSGIRMHPGNDALDTDGCLLPGSTRLENFVGYSRDAFERLFIRLKAMIKTEKIYITIIDTPIIK